MIFQKPATAQNIRAEASISDLRVGEGFCITTPDRSKAIEKAATLPHWDRLALLSRFFANSSEGLPNGHGFP
jgi:hypothetical protein